jgi:photosystem II stability/assembly factor-like uncharacterized protein
MRTTFASCVTCAGLALLCACTSGGDDAQAALPDLPPNLEPQESGTVVLLQAVSAINDSVVWVAGHHATFARTVDGGATWQAGVVPGPDTLQFRDVHGVDARTAYLLAAGPGDMSRIYKTTDAGKTWSLQFVNTEPRAFFDCFDFWNPRTGVAMSDAVDGRLVLIRTTDGGATWSHVAPQGIPEASGTEGGFAASGTCLIATGQQDGWIGTGAGTEARVLRSTDGGITWSAHTTPIVSGSGTSGITTVVVADPMHAFVLGGEIVDSLARTGTVNVATTRDGGVTWAPRNTSPFRGAVYGAAAMPGAPDLMVAAGPRGLSLTFDAGLSWTAIDTLSYWAVDLVSRNAGWAVGPNGRITRIDWQSPSVQR